MRVLIASGGTGGHIFPAVSVAEEIKSRRPGARILFMVATNKALRDLSLPTDATVVRLPAVGMPRKLSGDLAPFAFRLMVSFARSMRWMMNFRPHVAVGFGNFSSFAPLLAAKIRGVPIAIHEANAIPGKANLLLARLSDRVLVSFPPAARLFPKGNAEVVGMPLRKEFTEPRNRLGALAKLNLSGTRITLLVVGGSQGANALNVQMSNHVSILQSFSDKVQLIHLTGASDYQWLRRRYAASSIPAYVAPFDSRMKLLYDAADLVVARAGASTIAEIIQTGKPTILVPFPYATARHQDYNARYLEENGGAIVLKQKITPDGRVTIPGLAEKLLELINDTQRLQQMADNNRKLASGPAARNVVDVLFRIAQRESVPEHELGKRVAVPA